MITTSNQLVTKVLRRCFWPATDGDAPLSHAEIMAVADEEILGEFWPQVLAAYGDQYLGHRDYDITADQAKYRIPNNAWGPVRDVVFVDDAEPDVEISVPLMSLEEVGRTPLGVSACGFWHYFDGDFIALYPKPDTTENTLRVKYFRHPNTLVATASATTISSFSGSYGMVVAANAGSWSSSSFLDVISAGNAHQILVDNGDVSTVVSTTITFDSADLVTTLAARGVAVGDYVATTGQTPIVQLPDHMIPALVRRVAAECLRLDGDRDAAREENAAADKASARAEGVSKPRTQAESTIVVTRNSPIRMGRW